MREMLRAALQQVSATSGQGAVASASVDLQVAASSFVAHVASLSCPVVQPAAAVGHQVPPPYWAGQYLFYLQCSPGGDFHGS